MGALVRKHVVVQQEEGGNANYMSKVYNILSEAISRRDFLGGKKKPKEMVSNEPVKNKLKTTSKKISRREFVKKGGVGAAVGATANPLDAVLNMWPNITSAVVTKNLFDNSVIDTLEYFFSTSQNDDKLLYSINNIIKTLITNKVKLSKDDLLNIKQLKGLGSITKLAYTTPEKLLNTQTGFNTFKKFAPHMFETEQDYISELKTWSSDIEDLGDFYSIIWNEHQDKWFTLINSLTQKNLISDKLANTMLSKHIGFKRAVSKEPLLADFRKKFLKETPQDDDTKHTKKVDNNPEKNSVNYPRFDTGGGSEDVGYAKYYEKHTMSKVYNILNEAMSRRDFLGGGKKKPKEPTPTEPVKEEPKNPKTQPTKMSRREFVKKTGGGALAGALTPIDLALGGWPAILSQVVAKIDPKVLLNKSLVSYLKTIGSEGILSGDKPQFSLETVAANIATSIGKLSSPYKSSYKKAKKAATELLNVEIVATYTDKYYDGKLTKNDKTLLGKLVKNIFPDQQSTEDKIDDVMTSLQEPDLIHFYYENVLQYCLDSGFVTVEAAKQIYQLGIKQGLDYNLLAKYGEFLEYNNVLVDELTEEPATSELTEEPTDDSTEEPTDDNQNAENAKDQEAKKQKKNEKRKYNKLAKSIDYSRMDKAGGSEDVGYAKYYEKHDMSTYNNTFTKIMEVYNKLDADKLRNNAGVNSKLSHRNNDFRPAYRSPSGAIDLGKSKLKSAAKPTIKVKKVKLNTTVGDALTGSNEKIAIQKMLKFIILLGEKFKELDEGILALMLPYLRQDFEQKAGFDLLDADLETIQIFTNEIIKLATTIYLTQVKKVKNDQEKSDAIKELMDIMADIDKQIKEMYE